MRLARPTISSSSSARLRVSSLGAPVELQRKTDVLQGRALHEQVELLKNHAHGTPRLAQRGLGQTAEIPAFKKDASGRGAFQHVDATHQRGLARAALADDAENVSPADGKVNAAQGEHVGIFTGKALFQMLDTDDGAVSHNASAVTLPLRQRRSAPGASLTPSGTEGVQ